MESVQDLAQRMRAKRDARGEPCLLRRTLMNALTGSAVLAVLVASSLAQAQRRVPVSVPPIVGATEERAQLILRRAELVGEPQGLEPSDQPPGTVARQDPEAGASHPRDGRVRYWLAERRVVPPIVGEAEQRAQSILGGNRLVGDPQGLEPSDQPPGTVTRQDPVAGAPRPRDGRVRYWVAEQQPVVPSIVGETEQRAQSILGRNRLVGDPQGLEPSAQAAGTITRQDPEAGAPRPSDGRVGYWVAEQQPVVPPIVGETEERAQIILQEAGCAGDRRGLEPSAQAAGTITRQDPEAGAPRPSDGRVGYWVAERQPVVPSIVGETEERAQIILQAAGLLGDRQGLRPSGEAPGTVTRQDPRAGAPRPRDRRVSYWLAPPQGGGMSPVQPRRPNVAVPWGWIVGGLVAIAAAGYLARRILRPPRLTLVPVPDFGEQSLESPSQLLLHLELRVVVDPGDQDLETSGSLIVS